MEDRSSIQTDLQYQGYVIKRLDQLLQIVEKNESNIKILQVLLYNYCVWFDIIFIFVSEMMSSGELY